MERREHRTMKSMAKRSSRRKLPAMRTESPALDPNSLAGLTLQLRDNPQSPIPNSHEIIQMQRMFGNRYVRELIKPSVPKISAAHSTTQSHIQRLNYGEEHYQNTLKRGSIPGLANKPAVKNFFDRLSIYQDMVNTQTFPARDMEKVLVRLQRLNDSALNLLEYARSDELKAILESHFTKPSIFKIAQSAIERVGKHAVEDATLEYQALQQIQTMNGLGQPRQSLSLEQAIFLVRSGSDLTTILGDNDLAPGENGNEEGNPQELGGGQITKPVGLDFLENGQKKRRVFKGNEMTTKEGPGADIDLTAVYSVTRVMAGARVQALIKQKMIQANHEFESLIGGFDFALYKGKLGTVSDFAPGQDMLKHKFVEGTTDVQGTTYMNVDLNDISLQQQMANLQLFDFITGQLDRHLGNAKLVQGKGKKTKLTGIDQDFAFGTGSKTTETLGKTAFPKLVDRAFAEAILDISPKEFEKTLQGLMSDEYNAAVERFKNVQVELMKMLAGDELIVAPNEKQKYPKARTWAEISLGEYRVNGLLTMPSDYMGNLRETQEKVVKAIKDDPRGTKPKRKDGKWVIQFNTKNFFSAREQDGSDLWTLYRQTLNEIGVKEEDLSFVTLGGSRSRAKLNYGDIVKV